MATLYVSSVDGNDTTPPSVTWWNGSQSTYASLVGATGAAADGDLIYVDSAHDHNYTSTAFIHPAASEAVSIISVNRSTGAPLAGATETMNSSTGTLYIGQTHSASMFIYGCNFVGGTTSGDLIIGAATTYALPGLELDTCTFTVRGASTSAELHIGNSGVTNVRFKDCTFTRNTVSADFMIFDSGRAHFVNCSFVLDGVSIPSNGVFHAVESGVALFDGCDFTGLGTGDAYFNNTLGGEMILRNCVFPAGYDLYDRTGSNSTTHLTCIDSSDGTTTPLYEFHHPLYDGYESTSVYPTTGGYSQNSTPYSIQVITAPECRPVVPAFTPWAATYAVADTEITVSMKVALDSATVLDNSELWLEVYYANNESDLASTQYSGRVTLPLVTAASNHTDSSESWEGTSGWTDVMTHSLSHTFTPTHDGLVYIRLGIAMPSTTLYYDPKVRIS